jgi:hypothetical protein
VASREVHIDIALPLEHQEEPLAGEARFKVWRWGRRAGKTRAAFRACCRGHGAKPNGRGFLDGGEIIWISRDYPNSDTVWRKEILRRFANKHPITVNKQDRRVEFQGGSLTVYSADNIDSIRGGDWDGAVISEAAHMDLDTVFHEVVRPGLVDRKGWAIIESTSKSGSYFNDLCERVMLGEMGPVWKQWHRTAFDNPVIDDAEVHDLIASYDDEVMLKQEMYAELVVPGGFAFGEWNSSVHVMKQNPPKEWNWVGCMDWGYVRPGYFGLCALGPDAEMYFRKELKFTETEPFVVGFTIGMMLSGFPRVPYIASDPQMWSRDRSENTIADEVQAGLRKAMRDEAPALIEAPKGPGSRIRGKVLMHKALKWEASPDNPNQPRSQWKAPRMRFHEDCAYAITSIPKLARDPNNPEDCDTKGEDHAFDAIKGLLLMHNPFPEKSEHEARDPDRHPGLTKQGRRKPWEPDEDSASHSRYQGYAGYVG